MASFDKYAPILKKWEGCGGPDDEMWADIPGYNGKYLISTYGRVLSLKRNGIPRDTIISPIHDRYLYISLRNGERKKYTVHRLVAMTFLPNPNNLPQIDHIDGNRYNNHVSNLRWVTAMENSHNPLTVEAKKRAGLARRNTGRNKYIEQRDKKGSLIATYPSLHEAERLTGICRSNIVAAATGKRRYATDHWATVRSAGGFLWNFVN